MAKRSANELDAIIRHKLPGYHLARRADAPDSADSDAAGVRRRPRAAPEATTPSIKDLRSKYLGGSDTRDADLAFAAEEGAEIVTVEPDVGDDNRRHAKAVVISPDGEILGAQG